MRIKQAASFLVMEEIVAMEIFCAMLLAGFKITFGAVRVGARVPDLFIIGASFLLPIVDS